MKRILRYLRRYKLFGLALLTLFVGLILQLSGQPKIAHWILAIIAILEVLPLVWDMVQDVRHGSYGIDILAITAIAASVALGQYWAAIVVVIMLTGGESLEDYAHRRAQSELDSLLEHAPQTARVIRKGKTLDIKVSDIRIGDKLVIRAGELVPADAVVLDGSASFDESSLTGESLPQLKQVQATLLSGSVNLDGEITAKATAIAADSQYQQIIKLVRGAAGSQAPFVRLADRYSLPFTFTAYAIASAVWIVSGHAIRFLEVIVVATPCPLLLAAPIALISGMARASRYGIIVKTGGAFERLAEARTIAFDKTGTLTYGELRVDTITAFGSYNKDSVLGMAASLEQSSNHVVGRAVLEAARAKNIKLSKAKHVKELSGLGLSATLKGNNVIVGRLGLLQESNVELPAKVKTINLKQTAVYVASDSKLAGIITLQDELRSNARTMLQQLDQLGLRQTVMVTGDNEATAKAVARQLGIDHVHADALPAEKLHILDEIKDRPLVFVGDGVNDAPILTASDVGIALGARGSTAASESADMVIMLDDVGKVATAYLLAKRTFQIARQSILIGIGLSIILMLVFATGKFPPLAGAIVQEVVDVFVIFNALRAHLINVETS